MATKIRYPKCPYCQKQFQDSFDSFDGGQLAELATRGWMKGVIIKCTNCDKKYKVTATVMFYGGKLKGK